MDKLTTFEIRFPSYTSGSTPKCGPRSTLAGVVYLQTPAALSASCISLSFVGSERIALAPPTALTNYQHAQLRTAQKSIKRIYFNQTTVLWGDPKLKHTAQLAAGTHMLHFACEFPNANYPQTRAAAEFAIKYTLRARVLGARSAGALLACARPVAFMPDTALRAPLAFRFSARAHDTATRRAAFAVHVTGAQSAYRPGDTIELSVRIEARAQRVACALHEQTDCFYPRVPQHTQADAGRLWTCVRALNAPVECGVDKATCAVAVAVPADAHVGASTGFLRTTHYVAVDVVEHAAWGAPRRSRVCVPVRVVSRVWAELRASCCTAASDATATDDVRRGRSLVDLGARLHTLLPRRISSSHRVADAPECARRDALGDEFWRKLREIDAAVGGRDADDAVRPTLDPIMVSYRSPAGAVSTYQQKRLLSKGGVRYSRLSAVSVSSNDTVASAGRPVAGPFKDAAGVRPFKDAAGVRPPAGPFKDHGCYPRTLLAYPVASAPIFGK